MSAKTVVGDVTVTVALPTTPSTVARTAVVPAFRPVTSPDAATEAIVLSAELHATARPVRRLPNASRGTAESTTAVPTAIVGAAGVTSTDVAGVGRTCSATLPDRPPAAAMTVTVPGEPPRTTPV